MFKICGVMPLLSECNDCFQGIAFDGFSYYLTVKGKEKIIKYDQNFQCEKVFCTNRIYTAICYDSNRDCFWAAARGCFSRLFKLDSSLQEIDSIRLEAFYGVFSGVSYCGADNSLLVSIGEKILHIDLSSTTAITEVRTCPDALVTGVTSMSPRYLYHFLNGEQRIRVIAKDGSIAEEYDLPEGHIVEQVIYLGHHGDFDNFQALTTKQGRYPHLLELQLSQEASCTISTADASPSASCGTFCDSPCGNTCASSGCYPPPRPCPPHPCPPYPPESCSYCQSCNNVLESIALVETAISHILNAEGEKIQKAIASTDCIAEILEVNQSVNKTIIYVTSLEQVLYSKLDALHEYCSQDNISCEDHICNDNRPHNSCSSDFDFC